MNPAMASGGGTSERDYHHPFNPYPIQVEFMDALYECIETGKVGIFESPTGTGKSLSLACGSLTWLRDHKRSLFEEGLQDDATDDDEPAWMLEHARAQKRQSALARRAELEARLARIREREQRIKDRASSPPGRVKRQKRDHDDEGDEEARFLLDEYESDDEVRERNHGSNARFGVEGLSAATQALMEKAGYATAAQPEEEEAQEESKIFFCSRTHSQLSQFVGELRRLKLPAAVLPEPSTENEQAESSEAERTVEELKQLSLGSRKNLCINSNVSKLGSATAINERCLELQQPGTAADKKCPHLPNKETESLVHDFRDHAIAKIRDIEDLGELGQRLGICPYYASRQAIKPSEIVTLPYPLLLQKSAREALDLSVKDHVVIIDEAHNLMDAITGIYSIQVSFSQLQKSRGQLQMYLKKFNNRLKGKNRVYVAQTLRLIDSLMLYLQKAILFKDTEGTIQPSDLMTGKGVDQINIFKLTRYLQESKLARKVDSYIIHSEQQAGEASGKPGKGELHRNEKRIDGSMPTLTHIQSFLVTLMNPSDEGRFFYSRLESSEIILKYMLLDPSHHFREIVDDARAVILAGGTMSPMDDYVDHLLPYLTPANEKIKTLSCGHVIPPSNLLSIPVTRGPGNAPFNFTFQQRNSETMIKAVGRAILDLIRLIPDGVVVFFPSYAYLDQCLGVWRKSNHAETNTSMLAALEQTKPLFYESRSENPRPQSQSTASSEASPADSILTAYASAIRNPPSSNPHRGALLLAVIGGSLSEGINFSDSLGRGVLVIGLPFPNPHSAAWRAKAAYIAARADGHNRTSSGREWGEKGKAAVREHYENVCMRAVNQCIGRAIRHANDYAAIVLLDERFAGERIKGKLPGWMKESLKLGSGWDSVCRDVQGFFEAKA